MKTFYTRTGNCNMSKTSPEFKRAPLLGEAEWELFKELGYSEEKSKNWKSAGRTRIYSFQNSENIVFQNSGKSGTELTAGLPVSKGFVSDFIGR